MTITEWFLNLILIALVLLQIRKRRLTVVQVLLPIGLVLWAAFAFVHAIPLDGKNAVVIGCVVLAGAMIGGAIGFTTRMSILDDRVTTQAGILAALLWVAGMGARLAFQLWATGAGRVSLGRFDYFHAISNNVWPAALVLMAGATVLLRVGVILSRARRLRAGGPLETVGDGVRA